MGALAGQAPEPAGRSGLLGADHTPRGLREGTERLGRLEAEGVGRARRGTEQAAQEEALAGHQTEETAEQAAYQVGTEWSPAAAARVLAV